MHQETLKYTKKFLLAVYPYMIALACALFTTRYIIVNALVPSGSMETTIMPGNRLFGSRLTYKFSEPQRGDIIVFKYPVFEALIKDFNSKEDKKILKDFEIESTNYIKRLIGLPGETIDIVNGKIYVNGSKEALEEPYLKEKWTVENDGFHFEVPEDCYLMLGDNRNDSADSRYWADEAYMYYNTMGKSKTYEECQQYCYVRKDQIVGKAYLRYWPLTKIGPIS